MLCAGGWGFTAGDQIPAAYYCAVYFNCRTVKSGKLKRDYR